MTGITCNVLPTSPGCPFARILNGILTKLAEDLLLNTGLKSALGGGVKVALAELEVETATSNAMQV